MNNLEDIIQAESYQWFHNNYPEMRGLLFAVPNGGKRDPITMNKMKSTGLYPGIPDLIFMLNGKGYGFECKVPGGKLTGEQPKVHATWDKFGNPIYMFYSLEEFKLIMLNIIT